MMVVAVSGTVQAQRAASALAERVLGKQADKFVFVQQCDTVDFFTLCPEGGRIRIVGNNDNSMAVGLNYYLKEYAKVHVSWYSADPVELPHRLPRLRGEETHRVGVGTRFFLNYCTYGYTMVWWKWEQWERFIDWMALNGINMPLALTGQEAVWQEVWRELGMTDDEIRDYFSGPAHLPWHRMANLDGFGGPLPQNWIDGQKELQKQILQRERELNMTPVLPAFAGHIPRQIAESNPRADVKQLSSWCGFEPTYFLSSTDSLFAVIQRKYLEKQTALYGTDHIYGADPFNEMDPPSWEPEYLAGVSGNIYESMRRVDDEARWLQMSWVFYYKRKQWTPERLKAYLTAVPQGRMVLLDYFCEKTEVWRETEGMYGQPFVWCYLGNFGGNTMLVGDLNSLNEKLDRALEEQGGNMIGIGSTLEGFDNSPHTYEFLFEHPWNLSPSSERVGDFARRWADCRYGKANAAARAAWKLLVDSVYKDWSFYGLGSQMVARPSFSGHGTYYTKPFYSYDNETLLRAIRLMLDKPSKRAGYQYDVANLMSQWMGNRFMEVRDAFTDAFRARDIEGMRKYSTVALNMIKDVDRLMIQVTPNFHQWWQQAAAWGRSDSEKKYYQRQARTLLTIWGGPVLNDYANRMWGGLMPYYEKRWEMFFSDVIVNCEGVNCELTNDGYRPQVTDHRSQITEKSFDAKLSDFEDQWATRTHIMFHIQDSEIPSNLVKSTLNKIDRDEYDVPVRAEAVLNAYMKRYPEAHLVDVYKFCFQDVYGPAHLIKDTAACRQAISEELALVDTADKRYPLYEYVGIEGNYVRVNLSVIKDGRVPLDTFVNILIAGAKVEKPMPQYDWQGQWMRLQNILRHTSPIPQNFEADAASIADLLRKGRYVAHHSTHFDTTYNPHYRLIRRDIFEKQILPKILNNE